MLINCQFVILRNFFFFFKRSHSQNFVIKFRSQIPLRWFIDPISLTIFGYICFIFLTFNEQTIFIFITRNFYVYREANSCADRLIRMGAELTLDHLFLCNPPPMVVDLLCMDKAGHVCNRLIVS